MSTLRATDVVADRGPWRLDSDLVFLNHGSFGSCPAPVLEVQSKLREELERSPVKFLGREIMSRLDEVRSVLAPFLGCGVGDLAFVPNATTAVNSILRSMEFEPGDEIIITNHGYNACNNVARFVADRAQAKVVVAEIPFPLNSVEKAVEAILSCAGENTRLALLDHVTSATGLVLPMKRLVQELKQRGIETLVDGAHAPGMLELDLRAMGVAYYTGNAHKWMCTPKGSALLYVREDLQESVRPAVISHGANATVPGRSRYQLEFDWCGTGDPTGWLAIPAGLEFMRGLLPGGWKELRESNRALALEARRILCAALEIDVPAPDEMIGSLAAMPLPDADDPGQEAPSAFDVDPLQTRLFEEDRIEVPISPWPAPPKRILRVSAQFYNRIEEYELLAAALTRHLAQ